MIYGRGASIYGGPGNDLIYGPHKLDNGEYGLLYGGPGNDKIIGGDDNYGTTIYGEDGDDRIYGGNSDET